MGAAAQLSIPRHRSASTVLRLCRRHELEQLARGAGLRVVSVRAAVFFLPSSLAARAMAPLDPLLARLHAPSAAFLALAAEKPDG